MRTDSSNPRRVRVAEGIYKEGKSFVAGYRYPQSGRWTMRVRKDMRTLGEAKRGRRNLLADLEAQRIAPNSKLTVTALAREWLATREGRVKPRTYETDARGVALIERQFGALRVQD